MVEPSAWEQHLRVAADRAGLPLDDGRLAWLFEQADILRAATELLATVDLGEQPPNGGWFVEVRR
ncbi:MAG: hypothetical protein HY329_13995 [Chloroflexi bacterium]|nr:hypothetical protein [Chloroflexota bacterium]